MKYPKSKIIAKQFCFYRAIEKKEVPAYVSQYIKKEKILAIYQTERDYGVFTDKKIVLFDNTTKSKQVYSIMYKAILSLSIVFQEESAEMDLLLDSGYQISLHFTKMNGIDKRRLRILYVCVDKLINGQEPIQEDMKSLINNDIKL